jgi:hypothetical protein
MSGLGEDPLARIVPLGEDCFEGAIFIAVEGRRARDAVGFCETARRPLTRFKLPDLESMRIVLWMLGDIIFGTFLSV